MLEHFKDYLVEAERSQNTINAYALAVRHMFAKVMLCSTDRLQDLK